MEHNTHYSDMEEKWKDISGYERLYEVSNLGRVRSKDRIVFGGRINRLAPGCELNPRRNSCGYLRVQLCKYGIKKWFFVHRLVAEAFVSNPEDLPQVNHRDEDKKNNRADNLEWVTASDNCRYGNKPDATRRAHSIPVEQYSLNGELIASYTSTADAAAKNGLHQTHICSVCLGKRKTCGGYIWKYKQ